MNKKMMLSVALTVVLSVGTLVSGVASHADVEYEQAPDVVEYANEFVKQGVITTSEASKLIEVENELDKLFLEFDNMTDEEFENMSEAQLSQYDEKIDKLFDEVEDIYLKIEDASYYSELQDKDILTEDEIKMLQLLNDQIDALYKNVSDDMSDAEYERLMEEEEKIYNANKELFDKVDDYYASLDEQAMDGMYDEFVQSGELTPEELEQIKAVDAQVDKLLNTLDDNSSDEQIDAVFEQIESLYDDVDFFKDCGVDCDDK